MVQEYGEASGQRVNLDKTMMVFRKNTSTNNRETIRALWTNGTI